LTILGGAGIEPAGIWIVALSYSVFLASLHGFIAHSFSQFQKASNIFYPFIMGVIFAFFLMVFIYFILPNFVPPFVRNFNWRFK
jgi:uncharacterized BrkB/YihY/UPF0761 family membrane protein